MQHVARSCRARAHLRVNNQSTSHRSDRFTLLSTEPDAVAIERTRLPISRLARLHRIFWTPSVLAHEVAGGRMSGSLSHDASGHCAAGSFFKRACIFSIPDWITPPATTTAVELPQCQFDPCAANRAADELPTATQAPLAWDWLLSDLSVLITASEIGVSSCQI